jgi:hypothetical protein
LEDATLSIQLKNFESLAFITSKYICKYIETWYIIVNWFLSPIFLIMQEFYYCEYIVI